MSMAEKNANVQTRKMELAPAPPLTARATPAPVSAIAATKEMKSEGTGLVRQIAPQQRTVIVDATNGSKYELVKPDFPEPNPAKLLAAWTEKSTTAATIRSLIRPEAIRFVSWGADSVFGSGELFALPLTGPTKRSSANDIAKDAANTTEQMAATRK